LSGRKWGALASLKRVGAPLCEEQWSTRRVRASALFVSPFRSARVAYGPRVCPGRGGFANMIRIAISQAAFDAVSATLVLGTVAVEPERDEDGSVHIWLDPHVLAKLKALRGPGESYSDVILRVADE
jgi:hypothetical protein